MTINNHSTASITEAEQQCIRIAQEKRINFFKDELKNFVIWETGAFKEYTQLLFQIDIKSNRGKWKQISLIFVFIFLWILFILTALPFVVVISAGIQMRGRILLAKKIRDLETGLCTHFDPPKEKTLKGMWDCYGFNRKLGQDNQFKVIALWLETLYGTATRKKFDFDQIASEIRKRQFEVNRAWYEGVRPADHADFIELASSLVWNISKQLPPYVEVVL
jgi:hypothetical protein